MNKLLILDGNSLANRAFYALPNMRATDGTPTGAVYGFVNIIIKLIQEKKPTHIAVAFDHARKTFRNEIFADYKGTRKPMPDDLRTQMPLIKEILEAMNIKIVEEAGIEADDIIGTIAKTHQAQTYLISGDRDLWQLIDKNIEVWFTKKGVTDLQEISEKVLEEEYGLMPSQVIDLKSLMGDSSDNIPGVKGIGEVSAKKLLADYKTLDGVYEHIENITGATKQKLIDGKESAYISYKLATIKTDCKIETDIENFTFNFPFNANVYKLFNSLNFNNFTKRKELFCEDAKLEISPQNTKTKVETLGELKAIFEQEKPNQFVFNFLNKLYIEVNNKYFTAETQLSLFSDSITEKEVLDSLSNYFNDKNILKITNHLKQQMPILENKNINLDNKFYDVEIAEYLTSGANILNNIYGSEILFEKYAETKNKLLEYKMVDLFYDIEMPLVAVLYDMEKAGSKIDEKILNELYGQTESLLAGELKQIHTLAGEEFNINSPKQLSSILFDKLGLPTKNNKKKSTGVEILKELENEHEIIKHILTYRKLFKLFTSYLCAYKDLITNSGDIIHTVFNQTGTQTGRLASSDPNLQNIPVRDELGKNLRKLFISRFNNGKLISADYSQAELRLIANFSNDEIMINDFKSGLDIHSATASKIFDISPSEVTPDKRRLAKAVNFGIIYGISEYGLSENIGVSPKQAKEYIQKYFEKYYTVKKYLDDQIEFAKQNKFVKTLYNRRRNIAEIDSSNYMTRQFGERVAMNMPLQGSVSDIMKIAMIKIYNFLNNNTLKSKLILQIHDELILDCPQEEVQIVSSKLKQIMESITNLPVPLIADVNVGSNLFECK